MTKKMLWYVTLGLLCCGLGAWAVNARVASQQARNGMTDVRGQSITDGADLAAIKAARVEQVKITNQSDASRSAAQKAAVFGVSATPVRHTAAGTMTSNAAVDPAAAAYERWLVTGTKTAEEAVLIEQYFARNTIVSDRNPLDLQGGPDAAGYRFVDNQGGDTATFAWIELCGDPNATDGPTGDDGFAAANWTTAIPFYGTSYTGGFLTPNGRLVFVAGDGSFGNVCIDGVTPANPYIAPYWDDLYAAFNNGCNGNGTAPWIRYRDFGTHVVIQWQVSHFSGTADNYAFEIVMYPNGKIKFQYDSDWNDAATPNSATIGIDHPGAGNGLQYRCELTGPGTQITGGRAIWFYQPAIPGVDLRVSQLSPCGTLAPNPTQGVSLRVTNHGQTTSAATTARFDWDGGTTTGTGAVPALATDSFFDVFFATTVNLTLGAHTLIGHVDAVAGEAAADTANNTATCNVNGNNCADDCAQATPVACPATFDCDNTGSTHDCGLLGVGEGETWHAFTTTQTSNVVINLCGLNGLWGDFYIVLTQGCPCASWIFSNGWTFPAPGCIEINYIALPAGTYYLPILNEAAFQSVGEYHVEVTCTVPPPCVPDFVLNAPGTQAGANLGEGDDCQTVHFNLGSEDQTIEVNIPTDGNWNFSLCDVNNFNDSYIYLLTECCGGTIIDQDDDGCAQGFDESALFCVPLLAGTYYLLIEEYSPGSGGTYTLTVDECPPCIITPTGIAEAIEVQDSTNETQDPNGGCNNDDCGGVNTWSTASCNGDFTGSTFYYVSSQACGGGGIFRDTDWWEITLTEPESLVVTVVAENPANDFVVFLTDNNCATGPGVIASAQQIQSCIPIVVSSPECMLPGTYYIVVLPASAGTPGFTWDYNIHVACTPCTPCTPPANDLCENAVDVGVLGGTPLTFNGNNFCAREDCASLSGGAYTDSWYRFTTTETCTLKIDFCGSSAAFTNFYIVLTDGCPCNVPFIFYDVFNFTDCGDGMFTCYWYDLPAGTYYYPVLGQRNVVEGDYTITFGNCGTVCDALTDLRVYYHGVGVPHDGVNLYWSSPEDLNDSLRIYSTDSTDSDFDADGGADPDWQLLATISKGDSVTNDGFGITTRTYWDTRPLVRYRKYDVTRTYCYTPPPPPPPCLADSCELNEITATNGVPLTVDNTCATTFPTWPCGAGGKDVWISYTATATGTISASTCSGIGTLSDTVLESWTGCPSAGGTAITCLDDFCGVRTTISWAGTAGVTYKVRLAGFASGAGSAEIVITQ